MLHTTRGCCNSSQTRCTLCVQEANLLQFLHDTKIPKTRGARASESARVEWNYLFINLSFHPTRNRPSFRASVRGRLWCIQFGCIFFSFLLSREVYFQNQKWKLYFFFAAFYSDTEFFFRVNVCLRRWGFTVRTLNNGNICPRLMKIEE